MANPPFMARGQHLSEPSHLRSLSQKMASSNDTSYNSVFRTPLVTSADTENRSSISDLSITSVFSHQSSLGSFSSIDRKERRRRRKHSVPINTLSQPRVRSARIFQCTFCTDSFPAKYDWQRHEKSLHLPLDKWTCAPSGGMIASNNKTLCAFCKEPSPDREHLESHNYTSCQQKTIQERTFYRKDHLNQHLRLMHNVKFSPWMDTWRSTTTEIRSRCGFCGSCFTSWKERVDHLAAHFKNGADMGQWQGDWGFEPFVQRLVENAIPPYLIAQERATVEPFKTPSSLPSPGVAGSSDNLNAPSGNLRVPRDAICFKRLETELKAFINRQASLGMMPNDRMLQDEARRIVYGHGDPSNRTCADNLIWLSILKRDSGLETIPNSDHIQLENLGMQPPYAADDGLLLSPIETNSIVRSPCRSSIVNSNIQGMSILRPVLRSSAPHQGDFHRVARSTPTSPAGSFAGGTGGVSSVHAPALSNGWGSSNLPAACLSSSTPPSAPIDALVQMGFDPEFLEHLDDRYGELVHNGMEDLRLGDPNMCENNERGHPGGAIKDVDPLNSPLHLTEANLAPMSIPGSAWVIVPDSDTVRKDLQHFSGPHYFGAGGPRR